MKSRTYQTTSAAVFASAILLASMGVAVAQDAIQIGLSTKAWFPSFVAQLTKDQGFFEAEGVNAELTVYQSGSEALTAIAAGAADLISSSPNIVGNGRAAGVDAKIVALLATRNFGWALMIPTDSDITDPAQLAGKNVGITSAGSNTDLLAGWTQKRYDIEFNTVPLGGGGLVPNLISGNVEAIVVYPPLSYQAALDGNAKVLTSFGEEMPAHLEAGWASSDDYANDNPEALGKAIKALFRGVQYIQSNADDVIPKIAEYDGVTLEVARQEYEETFLDLSADGAISAELVEQSLDVYDADRTKIPDAAALFNSAFTPVNLSE